MENSAMKEIAEIDLHLYVLNRSLLDKEIAEEIERRIPADSQLAAELEEIKEFYSNYEQTIYEKTQKVFVLAPLNLKFNKPEQITLAAQQSTTTESRLKYVKSFLSAEKYVIVRMFHNPETKEYEFYVICEDERSVKNAIIKIPFLNKELITNEEGVASITEDYIPEDVEILVELQS
jgi:hypothetical protein